MSHLLNDKGVALVTSLLFTLISLGIAMALLAIVIQGTQTSGANKAYRTATEAGYGAVDVVTRDIIPAAMQGIFDSTYQADYLSKMQLQLPQAACFTEKLTKSTSDWSVCTGSPSAPAPKQSPDLTFNLKATGATSAGFKVYAKIIDTKCGGNTAAGQPCSNSDTSGIDYLDAGGGVASAAGTVTPQHRPAYYRLEVQSERAVNPSEKAALTVLYAY